MLSRYSLYLPPLFFRCVAADAYKLFVKHLFCESIGWFFEKLNRNTRSRKSGLVLPPTSVSCAEMVLRLVNQGFRLGTRICASAGEDGKKCQVMGTLEVENG